MSVDHDGYAQASTRVRARARDRQTRVILRGGSLNMSVDYDGYAQARARARARVRAGMQSNRTAGIQSNQTPYTSVGIHRNQNAVPTHVLSLSCPS